MKKCLLIMIGAALLLGVVVWLLRPDPHVVVFEDEVPVYGTDPLQHTYYVGSDDQYHHFQMQNGKRSFDAVVPVDAASIIPAPFPVESGRQTFVTSSTSGRIELFTAQLQAPEPFQQPE